MLGTVQSVVKSIADTADQCPRQVAQQLVIGTKLLKAPGLRIQQLAYAALVYDLTLGARFFMNVVYQAIFNPLSQRLSIQQMALNAKEFLAAVKFFTCSEVDSPLKKSVDSINAVVDLHYGWTEWSAFHAEERWCYNVQQLDQTIKQRYLKPVEYGCDRVNTIAKVVLAICHFGALINKNLVSEKVVLGLRAVEVGSVFAQLVLKDYYNKSVA